MPFVWRSCQKMKLILDLYRKYKRQKNKLHTPRNQWDKSRLWDVLRDNGHSLTTTDKEKRKEDEILN